MKWRSLEIVLLIFMSPAVIILLGCGAIIPTPPTNVQQDAETHVIKGYEYYQVGQFSEASTEFNKAIELRPDFADAYLGRGHAHQSLGQMKVAIADFDKAIELDPDMPGAVYLSRGNAYSSLDQWEKAIEDFNKAIELETTTPSESHQELLIAIYKGRGNAYIALGNDSLARQDFETVLTLAPNDPEARDIEKILELLKPQSTKSIPIDSPGLCDWYTESQLIRAERAFGLEKYVAFYRKYGPEGFVSDELSTRNELVEALNAFLPYEKEFVEKWEQLGSISAAEAYWEKELEAAMKRLVVFETMIEVINSDDTAKRDAVIDEVEQVNLIERESNAAMIEIRDRCLSD